MTLPVLYSFRRCPYAIRTRLLLLLVEQVVVIREIELRNKPAAMLSLSPKGTVPVLLMPDGTVLEESIDIMHWALQCSGDVGGLRGVGDISTAQCSLIGRNDGEFKHWLDRYKYDVRFPEADQQFYRNQAEAFLQELDSRLRESKYLFGPNLQLADLAIVPFIRQFASVDAEWFARCDYVAVRTWLEEFTSMPLFIRAMKKQPVWVEDKSAETEFPLTN